MQAILILRILLFLQFVGGFIVLNGIRLFSYDQNRGIPTAGTQHLKRWEYRSQDATPWTGSLLLQCYGGAIEKTTLTLRDARRQVPIQYSNMLAVLFSPLCQAAGNRFHYFPFVVSSAVKKEIRTKKLKSLLHTSYVQYLVLLIC